MKKQLVIGLGEIGSAIQNILGCDGHDPNKGVFTENEPYYAIHICIPYSENFIDVVEMYQRRFSPKITVVHSTVPVGTCNKLGAVHSPVTGRHPNMEEGIRTFTKYFGGIQAVVAALFFTEHGIKTTVYNDSDITEAMKLFSTTQYGLNILIEKEIHAWCERNNLPFEAIYTESNRDYNEGYEKLGVKDVCRSNLKHMDGAIGGHCVAPNLELLHDFPLGDLVKKYNDSWKKK